MTIDLARAGHTMVLRVSVIIIFPGILLAAGNAARSEDIVDRKGSSTPLRGEISGMSRTELTLKSSSKPEVKIPANEITRVRFSGENPQLNLIRAVEAAGNYRKALDGYVTAAREASASQANLKSDLEFLIARTTAKLAEEDPSLAADAAKKLEDFSRNHADNFRYFESVLLLGQLHMAANNAAGARSAFEKLSQAPWEDYRMAARNAGAKLLLAEGKFDEALKEYEAVIAAPAKGEAASARRHEALMGKAACLEHKKDFAQSAQVLEQILDDAAESDTGLQAEASVRLGHCQQAAGHVREAILAYLRVEVLFKKEKRWRAEALYQLTQLWETDGKSDRSQATATLLKTDYPDSEWAKKLAAAPEKSCAANFC